MAKLFVRVGTSTVVMYVLSRYLSGDVKMSRKKKKNRSLAQNILTLVSWLYDSFKLRVEKCKDSKT